MGQGLVPRFTDNAPATVNLTAVTFAPDGTGRGVDFVDGAAATETVNKTASETTDNFVTDLNNLDIILSHF
jgi:alpha-ketoglutarate-dependent taurine dioxygenase